MSGEGDQDRMPRSWRLTPLLVLLILAALWYVQAPPRTGGDYRERAAMTLETLRSQVQSTSLWIRELENERTTRQAASVAFREAEDDASAAVSDFAAWDPVGNTQGLRRDITAVGSDVTDALAAVRIAAEDERWDTLPELARPLPPLANRLERLARRADP